jgi:uncharacterized membrane protein (UPF0127 family)
MPIVNLTRTSTLATAVETADSPLKRMKGLLGRNSLNSQEALVITQCQSIHMFFMKFAIDVLFIDGKNKIVGVVSNIQPFQLSPIFWESTCAIELPAGTIETTKTEVGDEIRIS